VKQGKNVSGANLNKATMNSKEIKKLNQDALKCLKAAEQYAKNDPVLFYAFTAGVVWEKEQHSKLEG